MSIQELDRLGVRYHRNYTIPKDADGKNLRDDDGNVVKEHTTVSSVLLPLSSVEWCHIAMREGAHYMGGCCAHCSAMQDIVNGIFRDGGWASARQLRHLAEMAEHHEGFEAFLAEEQVDSLDDLDPWDKLGAVWVAAKDVLATTTLERTHAEDVTDFERAVWLAHSLMWKVSMARLFADDNDDDMRSGQRHANRGYNMLQILPPLRTVYDHLEKMSEQEFPGFGVRVKGTEEVVANGFGLCLYETREQAEELFRIWREAGDKEIDGWEILPVVVTVNDGLKWVEPE
jgi:hypothetical protein